MIKTIKSEGHNKSRELTHESQVQQKKWKRFLRTHENIPASYAYNLTICDTPKFLWYRNAKVGTRTTLKIMENLKLDLTAEHALRCYYSPQYYKDYFKFGFVRNPYDRLVSGWYDKVIRENIMGFEADVWENMKHFDRFVDMLSGWDLDTCNAHFRRQCRLIDINEVDYIGRMENFTSDLKEVFNILGMPLNEIPHAKKSSGRLGYETYYTRTIQQKVEKMYRKDIQLFGYSF
jgi:hypothetical protein